LVGNIHTLRLWNSLAELYISQLITYYFVQHVILSNWLFIARDVAKNISAEASFYMLSIAQVDIKLCLLFHVLLNHLVVWNGNINAHILGDLITLVEGFCDIFHFILCSTAWSVYLDLLALLGHPANWHRLVPLYWHPLRYLPTDGLLRVEAALLGHVVAAAKVAVTFRNVHCLATAKNGGLALAAFRTDSFPIELCLRANTASIDATCGRTRT